MNKVQNYLEKLNELIKASMEAPFSWGVMDCCVFAAKAVDAQYGTEIEKDTHSYSTEIGANRFIKKHATSLETLIDTYLNPVEIGFAQRGDIVLFITDNGPTTGLMWLNGVWSTAPEGLRFFTDVNIIKAWREPKCHQQ